MKTDCALCLETGDNLVFESKKWRIVLADDSNYPGFCRVIWKAHVSEMSDLLPEERIELMQVVWQIEVALRKVMRPHKINIASLGNMVPHLHWHVIPRYMDDAQFPDPVWAAAKRVTDKSILQTRAALLPELCVVIKELVQQESFAIV